MYFPPEAFKFSKSKDCIYSKTHTLGINEYLRRLWQKNSSCKSREQPWGPHVRFIFACIYMHTLEQEAWQQFLMMRHRTDSIILLFRWLDDIIAIVNTRESGL